MSTQNLTGQKQSGTTETEDNDCGCTTLMACWPCYRADRRGRPAIREARQ